MKGHVTAVGECGLDYERTKFCDVETQRKYFETQLELSAHTGLPLFLHNRASCDDLVSILDRHRDKVRRNSGLNRFCAPLLLWLLAETKIPDQMSDFFSNFLAYFWLKF